MLEDYTSYALDQNHKRINRVVVFGTICSYKAKGIHPFLETAFCINAITYAAITQIDSYVINKLRYLELLNHGQS